MIGQKRLAKNVLNPQDKMNLPSYTFLVVILAIILPAMSFAQETLEPPTLGQNTQGEVPVNSEAEGAPTSDAASDVTETSSQEAPQGQINRILGTTKISELRRENGQVYRIEFEHSSGSKQVIEEIDSDGGIESTNNDIEQTPNLPKWRLGSW